METYLLGVDKDQTPWYTKYVQDKHIMNVDETVALINVNISSRKFTIYSDTGNELVVDCETTNQFLDVFKVVRSVADIIDIKYDY